MFLGQTITKFDGVAWTSPPFPRGGDAATFVVECSHVHHSATLSVSLEHKNVEDTSYSTLTTLADITTTGVTVASASGIKEELRWKATITTADAEDAAVIIPYEPVWRPY